MSAYSQNGALERIVQMHGAFDRRSPEPSKNYGIHGMEIRFVLKGPNGAVQFLVYTPMHLPHVQDELWRNNRHRDWNPFKPQGADIGYHAYTPQHEGQTPMADCDILGVPCYYDGTSCGASDFMPTFLAGGSDAVWAMLEERYRTQFSAEIQQDPRP